MRLWVGCASWPPIPARAVVHSLTVAPRREDSGQGQPSPPGQGPRGSLPDSEIMPPLPPPAGHFSRSPPHASLALLAVRTAEKGRPHRRGQARGQVRVTRPAEPSRVSEPAAAGRVPLRSSGKMALFYCADSTAVSLGQTWYGASTRMEPSPALVPSPVSQTRRLRHRGTRDTVTEPRSGGGGQGAAGHMAVVLSVCHGHSGGLRIGQGWGCAVLSREQVGKGSLDTKVT